MINFFRKIRQNMISNGKFGGYMTYAIGEILLVVIGILIALSINNWNEIRKSQNNVRLMLTSIQEENTINIEKLKLKLQDAEHVRSTVIQLLGHMGANYESKDKLIIDSLFFEGLSMTLFDPNKAAFQNLIGSGNIKFIQNDSLHNIMLEWDSKLEAMSNAQSTTLYGFKTIVLPHFYNELSLVQIDRNFDTTIEKLPASAFEYDNRKALNSMVTENILEDHLYNLKKIQNRFEAIYKDLITINQLIENELN